MRKPTKDPEQIERCAVLENDRRVRGFTYHDVATAEADATGGRFAARSKSTVIGQAPIAYPRQQENSWPNQAAAVPDELPLGVDVNALEPIGTAAEIEQSLRETSDDAGPSFRIGAKLAIRRRSRSAGPSSASKSRPSPLQSGGK